ncbi:MAG: aminotransferase class I/II-fold pyridoxal phosphate-dependent enzyme [Rhodobacteraceae bacterium]|nr:aminotransferase class I/II-fold pyridoxal phosphate-dependent enzyme [Paracoccaceae bacterium]
MNFDERIERRGTHSVKWDMMESLYGVPQEDGIAMWVADMDFRPPTCVQNALSNMAEVGVYGYYGNDAPYRNAICWWMQERHGWDVDPSWIFTTHGLVNGTGMCVDAFTNPGDGVVLFTPVYHAFARVIAAADRQVVECQMPIVDGRYVMDFAAYDAQMTGNEKMVILCSPHNPGGRVWNKDELQGVADFARRHDLILVSDEIHHDLVYPDHSHVAMPLVDPTITDRLVMMTATTKTFNIAGSHSGNVIIEMAEAAYSPEGAQWVDELMLYLDGNRKTFDDAINAIPGAESMDLEATYLAWVDFAGMGMQQSEVNERVFKQAQIAANHGPTFGTGGETFLRFNIATPRSYVEKAAERLKGAFRDLQ